MKPFYFFGILLLSVACSQAQITQNNGNPGQSENSSNPGDENAFNAIAFDYDTAGNQTMRYFIYLAPPDDRHSGAMPADTKYESVPSARLTEAGEYPDISYYPNPVKAELFVRWKASGNTVKTIELYDYNGKMLRQFPNLETADNLTVNFADYPSGIYSLVLLYGNNVKKTLKIIKQ